MQIDIYTDGACSKNPGPGGFGVVLIINKTFKDKTSGGYRLTTNNRMELVAAIKAFELFEKIFVDGINKDVNIDLYSDSKYLVNAISQGWLNSWKKNKWIKSDKKKVLNIDLWEKILLILNKYKTNSINFIWVKGHDSNHWNNYCDSLAREAVNKCDLDIDIGYVT
jgi:ribonuclease HI